VQVNHGGTEMGQGLYTKVKGIAMRELGLPASSVRVMRTQTDKIPNTSPTAASSGSDLNGAAVRAACVALRERLSPVAAELLGAGSSTTVPEGAVCFDSGVARAPQVPGVEVPFERIAERAYVKQIPLSANGFYRTPGIGYDKSAGKGKPFYYFAYGAAVSEVVVDTLTGEHKLLAADLLHDVGASLNPALDIGQVEGAYIQGYGWLTMEELVWHPKSGALLTHAPSTYKIPTANDAPSLHFRTALFDAPNPADTIHRSKAVGEPPLLLPFSALLAIRDAISAVGGHRVDPPLRAPATPEAVLDAIDAVKASRS
jgi:xanthine dehydrogenase large subunit